MRTQTALHKMIKKSCPKIHEKRLSALLEVSNGLFNHGKLSLSSLGRHLAGDAKVKHKIKKVDTVLTVNI